MRSRIRKRNNRAKLRIEPLFLVKILLILVLYFLFFALLNYICKSYFTNYEFEKDITEFATKNKETVFEISEITLYSSANAKLNSESHQNLNLNISHFCDISFYISNIKNQVIQTLKIDDIEFTTIPETRQSYFELQKSIRVWQVDQF